MGKHSTRRAVLLAAVALAATGCGDDGDTVEEEARQLATTVSSGAQQAVTTVAGAAEGATRLKATLTGAAEAPGPGDPDGAGTATVNVDVTKREVCYEVTAQKIDKPTGAHIHEGDTGKAGNVVIPLTTPTASDPTIKGCANADAALVGRLTATPGKFYVNVHSDKYPQGAVRGQLSQ